MKYANTLLVMTLLLASCKSIETSYKHKALEAQHTTVDKILVVGLSENINARELFETKVVTLLTQEGMLAVKSLDYFKDDNSLDTEEIDAREQDLIDKGFNGILVSRVTGTNERKTILQSILNISNIYRDFDMDTPVKNNFENTDAPHYLMYGTQTALYCICADKEKALIWKTAISLKKHKLMKRDINRFSRYLVTEIVKDSLITQY